MTAPGHGGDAVTAHPLAAAQRLFRQRAEERLDLLSMAWIQLDGRLPNAEVLADIRSVAHRIGGTAAPLGHAALGRLAAEVERLCLKGADRHAVQRALRPLISALAELVDDAPPSPAARAIGSPLSHRPS